MWVRACGVRGKCMRVAALQDPPSGSTHEALPVARRAAALLTHPPVQHSHPPSLHPPSLHPHTLLTRHIAQAGNGHRARARQVNWEVPV